MFLLPRKFAYAMSLLSENVPYVKFIVPKNVLDSVCLLPKAGTPGTPIGLEVNLR